MTVVDANVLLYAVDASAELHAPARTWLDATPDLHETVALPWVSLQAFVRIATHAAIYPDPLTLLEAVSIVEGWLDRPNVVLPRVGPDHVPAWKDVLLASGTPGNLVNDAHVAAIALQHDARVATYDADFDRFSGVEWFRPGVP